MRLAVDITAFNTFVLIGSSVTVVLALQAIQKGDKGGLVKWLGISILLGSFFVGVQVYEYIQLIKHGALPNQDLFWSTFYAMTGFHGAHVTIGALCLIFVYIRSLQGAYTASSLEGVEVIGLYWHFVDLVWILLFTIVSLI
jgi:heme/copper-type cytochrome/quinol oxidase subunit 3